jgi:phosphoglycolate phosphatase
LKYRLIVFDWDGTLIDSADTIVECIQQASVDFGLPVPDRGRASHVIGLGLRDALRAAVPTLPPERYVEFAEAYRRHFLAREDAMRLFPGAREMLLELRDRGHKLAVATGKSRRGLDRALQAAGLGGCFAATRCADETHPKPHPAMLLELIECLAVRPSEALMVGDTSHDLDMAKSAGVRAVAVTYGAHAPEALRACGPHHCVDSVEALREWLQRNA